MANERYWIQVFKAGQGFNVGTAEGYTTLKECWEALKGLLKFYRGHEYEIIDQAETIVEKGVVG